MNKSFFTLIILAITLGMLSCQKDLSVEDYEPGRFPTPTPTSYFAKGSLQDTSGNNLGVVVNGSYTLGEALTTSNTITVTVNITTAGKYKIHTDTVNGCWFSMDSIVASNTGIQTVTLQGYGRPLVVDTATFTLHFLNSVSSFALITGEDYFPLTVGTYWTYHRDTVPNRYAWDSVTYTVTGLTQIIDGNTFKLVISNRKDTNYYRKDTLGHYYEYTNKLAPFIPLLNYMFLDETKGVNDSWLTGSYPTIYQGATYNIKLQCTILAKRSSFSLKNKTVDSTIEVQEKFLITDSKGNDYSSFLLADTVQYAKKIGLVEFDSPETPIYLRASNWFIK